jgi:hypothetical protein
MPIGPLGALGEQAHGIAPNLGPMNDPNDVNTLDPAINPQFQTLDPMQMLDVDKDVVPSTPPNQVTPQEQAIIGYMTAQPIAYQTPDQVGKALQALAIAQMTEAPPAPRGFDVNLDRPQLDPNIDPHMTVDVGKMFTVDPYAVLDPDVMPTNPLATMAPQVMEQPIGYQQAAPTQADALADAIGYANSQTADTGYGYGLSLGAPDSGIAGFGIGSIGAPGQGVSDGGYGFGIGAATGEQGGFGAPGVSDGNVGFGAPSGIAGVSSGDLGGQSVSGVTGQGFGDPGDGSSTGTASVGAVGAGTDGGFGAGATGVAGVSEGGALGGGVGIGGLGGGIGDGSASGTGVGVGEGAGVGEGGGVGW